MSHSTSVWCTDRFITQITNCSVSMSKRKTVEGKGFHSKYPLSNALNNALTIPGIYACSQNYAVCVNGKSFFIKCQFSTETTTTTASNWNPVCCCKNWQKSINSCRAAYTATQTNKRNQRHQRQHDKLLNYIYAIADIRFQVRQAPCEMEKESVQVNAIGFWLGKKRREIYVNIFRLIILPYCLSIAALMIWIRAQITKQKHTKSHDSVKSINCGKSSKRNSEQGIPPIKNWCFA